jgi:hypothetical protein
MALMREQVGVKIMLNGRFCVERLGDGWFSLSYLPLLEIRDHDSPNDRKATPMTHVRATMPQIHLPATDMNILVMCRLGK